MYLILLSTDSDWSGNKNRYSTLFSNSLMKLWRRLPRSLRGLPETTAPPRRPPRRRRSRGLATYRESELSADGEKRSVGGNKNAATARRVTERVDELRYPPARVRPFAVSGLARKCAPEHRAQLEEIFACIDGALHLHYAKFGQSLLALYSPFEPAATKSTQVVSVDTLFPAGFCPVDEILDSHNYASVWNAEDDHDRNSDGSNITNATSNKSNSASATKGMSRTEREIHQNSQARANIFRMTSCFLWLARRAAFRPVSREDQRLSEGNHFLMTTPVKVAWDFFDDRALNLDDGSTHYDQFKDEPGFVSPSFASKLLVLKRGRG